MPSLLHLIHYRPTGTRTFDHFILALAGELRDAGWDVRFAFAGPPAPEFGRQLREAGATYAVIPFPFTWQSARELVRQSAGFRPDVIQTSFISAFTPPLLALKMRGFTRRLIVIDHSSGGVPRRGVLRRWAARVRGWAVGHLLDAVLPVSETIARRNIEEVYLPAKKVRVVYNGVRLDLFPAVPRPPRDQVRVAYAGQLIPQKGVMTLLRAHHLLRGSGVQGYDLVVAGGGPQEGELKAFCRAAGREDVQFLGHIDSIADFFGAADIVVVPSEWHEAFGLVAAEAMACGAACVVSDAGALSEVVGPAGLVFRAGDSEGLAARLKALIGDPGLRQSLAAAGRARVEETFTLDQKVTQQVEVCRAVLADGTRPGPRGRVGDRAPQSGSFRGLMIEGSI